MSEQFLYGTSAQLGYTLYSAMHVGSHWKIQDKNTN